MQTAQRFTSLVVVSLAVVAASGISSTANHDSSFRATEVARIRAHFDSVLTELASRDVYALAESQRAHRAQLTATLRAYRDRGEFPRNYDFPGQAVPYFVDRHTGVLCAVAHLMESTGRRDFVDRVARADNNVWVDDLADNAEFSAWLDENGLTLAEAARIQVPYIGPEPLPPPPPPAADNRSALKTAAPIAAGAALAGAVWNVWGNANGHRRSATIAGFASGALATGLGVALMTERDAPQGVAVAGTVVGTLGAALATRALFQRRSALAAAAKTEATTTITPTVSAGNSASAGLSVAIRF